ncbi:hypothetical protein KKE68_00210, partial [Patescibacteria group bacterium]|nr:hypothetical protein [Patescibacteria group bacterium]
MILSKLSKSKGSSTLINSSSAGAISTLPPQTIQALIFESFDKIIISIMAKKIAFGSNHIVIDLPYGEDVKVHRVSDA